MNQSPSLNGLAARVGRDMAPGHAMHALSPWPRIIVTLSIVCLLRGAATAQPAQAPAPALPLIAVDTYPRESRDDVDAAYRRARARPQDAEAVGDLAMTLQAWDQLEAAAEVYTHLQALAPDQLDWWYFGGMTASRRALHAEAVAQFGRAEALAGGVPLVALRLADARLASGDLDGATTLYRRLVDVPECAPAAWYGLGRIHMLHRADAEARTSLERALSLYPDFGAAHYAMAQLQRRAGEADAARVSLARQRQCLACWPMPDDPWRNRIDGLRTDAAAVLTRGVASASAGTAAADAEAIRLHESALDRDLTRGQAHINLIELYGRTGNVAAAQEHYLAALKEPGFAADAHRAYGVVLLSLQQADEALTLLRKTVELSPRDAAALQGMGLALEMLNEPDAAARAYQDALRAAPSAREARFGLARVAMRQQKIDQAIALLEELREPRDAAAAKYLFALSVAYVRRGQLDAGTRLAHEALDVARLFGDTRMVATIEAELRKLKPAP